MPPPISWRAGKQAFSWRVIIVFTNILISERSNSIFGSGCKPEIRIVIEPPLQAPVRDVRFECGAFWCRIGKEDLLQGLGKGDTEKCENRVYGSLANNSIVRKFRYCRPFTIVDKPLYMYIGGMILLFLFLKSEKSLGVFCFCKNPSSLIGIFADKGFH